MRGHIRERGRGTWELRVFLGRDPITRRDRYKTRTFKGSKKDAEKELATLRQGQLLARAGELAGAAERRGPVRFVGAVVDGVEGADDLRSVALDVRQRLGATEPAVVVLGGVVKDRPVVVAATNEPARGAGVKAGALVRTAAGRLGGGGGGKDDVAQGGGTDTGALPAAVAAVGADLDGAGA